MLLNLCDLALKIIWNLLVFLNKSKANEMTNSKDDVNKLPDSDLEKILNEIRAIDSERKGKYISDKTRIDEVAQELKALNSRLKSIEFLLYEKKASLLREKIIGNYNKEEDG